ncbi:MAG: patatin family protein, partial [Eubacterium sp.]|nr:patatin family protein [Eubacterium sp.]
MYQAGLILEGGGMRGTYTAGVLDAFLENEIEFSSVYGVSAGSCHGCNYLSGQKERSLKVFLDYIDDPRYCSLKSLITTGDFFGVDMCYSQIPDVYIPYDYEKYAGYQGDFYVVMTNLETGKAEYHKIKDMKKQIWMVRASSSLPLISRTIIAHGRPYLDGGVSDSIPVKESIRRGNKKNVVILTRDVSYRKGRNSTMPLVKLRYKKYPKFIETMENRHIVYNETLAFIEKEEAAGNLFVIRPQAPVEVARLEKDKGKLLELYQQGLEDGRAAIDDMKA